MSLISKANPTWLNLDVIWEHFSTMPNGSVYKEDGHFNVKNRYNTCDSDAVFIISM